jgi:hypothetical protein
MIKFLVKNFHRFQRTGILIYVCCFYSRGVATAVVIIFEDLFINAARFSGFT